MAWFFGATWPGREGGNPLGINVSNNISSKNNFTSATISRTSLLEKEF